MFSTINKHSFIEAFRKSDTYKNNFSYEWLTALFEYLEEYEDSTGTQIEFDMVALCCYYNEISIDKIEQETGCESLNDLQYNTQVIEVNENTIIYQAF